MHATTLDGTRSTRPWLGQQRLPWSSSAPRPAASRSDRRTAAPVARIERRKGGGAPSCSSTPTRPTRCRRSGDFEEARSRANQLRAASRTNAARSSILRRRSLNANQTRGIWHSSSKTWQVDSDIRSTIPDICMQRAPTQRTTALAHATPITNQNSGDFLTTRISTLRATRGIDAPYPFTPGRPRSPSPSAPPTPCRRHRAAVPQSPAA